MQLNLYSGVNAFKVLTVMRFSTTDSIRSCFNTGYVPLALLPATQLITWQCHFWRYPRSVYMHTAANGLLCKAMYDKTSQWLRTMLLPLGIRMLK